MLSITVVVEFLCSLINPFAHLLKLYPIITWSRSDILLPWLVTHALNTILPKMLAVSLAFIFYTENIISTMSLLEFLVVESINLCKYITFYATLSRSIIFVFKIFFGDSFDQITSILKYT